MIRDTTTSWRVTVGINWVVSIGSISGDAENDDGARRTANARGTDFNESNMFRDSFRFFGV